MFSLPPLSGIPIALTFLISEIRNLYISTRAKTTISLRFKSEILQAYIPFHAFPRDLLHAVHLANVEEGVSARARNWNALRP